MKPPSSRSGNVRRGQLEKANQTRKRQRIAGLKALLEEWELSDNLDLDYIRGLRARLLSVKNQLKNMCGPDGSERMDDW